MSDLRSELQSVYDTKGVLSPQAVLETARDPQHPLHARFLWNDTEAAEKHRLRQAGDLIRRVRVVYKKADGTEERVRAFVSVRGPSTPSSYVPTESVTDPVVQKLILNQMRRELAAMERRYGHLAEFWDMINSMGVKTGT